MISKSKDPLRIIVLGYIVRGPMGGMAWHHLQYVMGLRKLGHDVYFIEDSDDSPWCCYDPRHMVTGTDPAYGLEFATRVFNRAQASDRWAYYDAPRSLWLGPCADRILDICSGADVVLNVSGANPIRPWLENIPARVLIDTDPLFTQIRNLVDPARMKRALQHNAFFSFGENIPAGRTQVPDDGLPWKATRQPIVLAEWPVVPEPRNGNFTTVMQWDSYATCQYGGIAYGMKSQSFDLYMDLPKLADTAIELSLSGPPAARSLLRDKGWVVSEPFEATEDPWIYQKYLQNSRAEFSVAKHGYVVSRSGWFSERTAAYLACGRPAVVQDTGFSEWLPVGKGLVSFTNAAEAAAGILSVNGNYHDHCVMARNIAEEFFSSDTVLTGLIESLHSSDHERPCDKKH